MRCSLRQMDQRRVRAVYIYATPHTRPTDTAGSSMRDDLDLLTTTLITFLETEYPAAPFIANNEINPVIARNITSYFNTPSRR